MARLFAFAVFAALTTVTPALHAAPRAYERWVRPASASAEERQILRTLRTWGKRHGIRLRVDARLARAAQSLVETVPTQPGDRFDVEHARRVAQRWGWTDGQLAALAFRADANQPNVLERQLEADVAHLDVNRVGVAVAGDAMLILLSRRLINLEPVSARIRRRSRFRIAGTLMPGLDTAPPRVQLAVQGTDGNVTTTDVACRGTNFAARVPAGRNRGVMRVEVLLDRGRGPEIAAVFPVGVATDPPPPSMAQVASRDSHAGDDAEAALVALILGSRQALGLPLPSQSAKLREAALAHARDMESNKFFAHVSPTSGDVTDRLRARSIPFVRAVENIATADSVEAAFQQWLSSPAHRKNLVDSDVTALGVGVVERRDEVFAVMVLARLVDDGGDSALKARAIREINRTRQQLGMDPLRRDPVLERLAAAHVAEITDRGEVTDVSPVHGALVDTVFDEADAEEAAADVYRANTVDVVTGSHHLREGFSRLGVGVLRAQARDGVQLWIAVIYAD